jgi:hypothetical protein
LVVFVPLVFVPFAVSAGMFVLIFVLALVLIFALVLALVFALMLVEMLVVELDEFGSTPVPPVALDWLMV